MHGSCPAMCSMLARTRNCAKRNHVLRNAMNCFLHIFHIRRKFRVWCPCLRTWCLYAHSLYVRMLQHAPLPCMCKLKHVNRMIQGSIPCTHSERHSTTSRHVCLIHGPVCSSMQKNGLLVRVCTVQPHIVNSHILHTHMCIFLGRT
jgi:hypothetical protein